MKIPTLQQLERERTDGPTISYFMLRQLIGFLGIFLPIALVTFGGTLQHSLSHYYYSSVHIIFVGTLAALSTFLITYKGTFRLENWLANIAGVCAAGVAIFPTNSEGFLGQQFLNLPTSVETSSLTNVLHYVFAAALFICFAIFCNVIFQKPDKNEEINDKKLRRNKIYKICGYLMIFSIVAMLTLAIFSDLSFTYSTLLFESTTLIPFGISWVLKGSYNWKYSDNKVVRKMIKPLR